MMNHSDSPPDPDAGPGGLRETLNEKPLLAGGAVFGLTIIVLLWQFWPERRPMAYYSSDDGKTFFEAPIQAPPIKHDGKEAVRAMVFSCGGEKFVGYLMRFTPEGKAAADKAMNDPNWKGGPLAGQEVKRPGSPAWVAAGGPGKTAPNQAAMAKAVRSYEEVISVRCPDGSPNALMVEPD